jgi:PD-(D/E)XK nuclease superfamily
LERSFMALSLMDRVKALQVWAALGALLASDRHDSSLDWTPVHALIEAVKERLAVKSARLRDLLEESRRRLEYLGEPFDVNLGAHRWLSDEREEAYSDWLAWVIEQVKEPEPVLRLLGLDPPQDVSAWSSTSLEVRREFPIPFGHEQRRGRLDLLIRYAGSVIIIVEVKTGTAEAADLAKQKGYWHWLVEESKRRQAHHFLAVLLAAEAEHASYENFQYVPWSHVCAELRWMASQRGHWKSLIVPAMILAFVGAVEQNVLGFPSGLILDIARGGAPFFNAKVVDHLARWLTKER